MVLESAKKPLLSDSDLDDEEIAPELYPCIQNGKETDQAEFRAALFELSPEGDKAKAAIQRQLKKRYKSKKDRSPVDQTACGRAVDALKEKVPCLECNRKSCLTCLRNLFPFLSILKGYSMLYDFPVDLIAGLTVGIMHIPQGMAYALLTQLPAVYGLYTSFFPVLVYFFFGTSRHISVGTFAVVSLMVGAVVDRGQATWQGQELKGAIQELDSVSNNTLFSNHSASAADMLPPNLTVSVWSSIFRSQHRTELEDIKVGYAMAVTFAVGGLQLLMGVLKLGFVTSFLSDPLISGFTTGAAVHVFSSQVKSAFGVKIQRFSGPFKLVFAYKDFFTKIGQTNVVTITACLSTMVILFIIKEGINKNKTFKKKSKGVPIPGELMAIIVGTALSYHFHLHTEFDVEIIGHIPTGFPTADLTFMKYLPDVISEAFAICFTAFAISFAISKIMADKHEYSVDPNQELIAHGFSNVIGSTVSSFCSAASLSRSMVQDGVGCKTQVVSLISCLLVGVVLVALGPLFEKLPNSILAGIIMVSLKGLFMQFQEMKRLWRVSRVDCSVWLVTFMSTVFLDVDLGLMIGLVYNLVPILLRTQGPNSCLLGNFPNTSVYVDLKLYREAVPVPGIKIFKFEAPLYFANMENFKQSLVKETGVDPTYLKHKKEQMKETDASMKHDEVCLATTEEWTDEKCESHAVGKPLPRQIPSNAATFAIVIDCSCIQYVDSVTTKVLREIIVEYGKVDIDVLLGECKETVRVMLSKSGLYDHVSRRNVCATIHHAVQVAQKVATMSKESLASCNTMAPDEFIGDGDMTDLDLDSIESTDKIATVDVEQH